MGLSVSNTPQKSGSGAPDTTLLPPLRVVPSVSERIAAPYIFHGESLVLTRFAVIFRLTPYGFREQSPIRFELS
jgi:hypothetical protein